MRRVEMKVLTYYYQEADAAQLALAKRLIRNTDEPNPQLLRGELDYYEQVCAGIADYLKEHGGNFYRSQRPVRLKTIRSVLKRTLKQLSFEVKRAELVDHTVAGQRVNEDAVLRFLFGALDALEPDGKSTRVHAASNVVATS